MEGLIKGLIDVALGGGRDDGEDAPRSQSPPRNEQRSRSTWAEVSSSSSSSLSLSSSFLLGLFGLFAADKWGELKCRWFHPGATRKRRRSNIAAFVTIRVHGAHERRDLLLSVALSLVEIFYKVVVFLADLRWWVYLDMSTGRDRSSS